MATVTCCKVKAVLIIFDVNSVPVTKILPFPTGKASVRFCAGCWHQRSNIWNLDCPVKLLNRRAALNKEKLKLLF